MSVNEAAQLRRAGKGQGNSVRPRWQRARRPHICLRILIRHLHMRKGMGAAQVWQGGGEGRGAPCVQSGTCAPDFKRKKSMVYVNYIILTQRLPCGRRPDSTMRVVWAVGENGRAHGE